MQCGDRVGGQWLQSNKGLCLDAAGVREVPMRKTTAPCCGKGRVNGTAKDAKEAHTPMQPGSQHPTAKEGRARIIEGPDGFKGTEAPVPWRPRPQLLQSEGGPHPDAESAPMALKRLRLGCARRCAQKPPPFGYH